jgi:hypothetical protein
VVSRHACASSSELRSEAGSIFATEPSESLNQVHDSDAERVRDDFESLNSHVGLASLNLAHVGTVQAGAIGEDILGPSLGQPQPPTGLPDVLLNVSHQQQFRGTLGKPIQVITCTNGGNDVPACKRAVCVLLFLFVGLLSFGQAQQTMTNEVVIKLVQSGVPPATIIRTIDLADSVAFRFLPADLSQLAQFMVPEDVVKAMAARANRISTPTPAAPPVAAPKPARQPISQTQPPQTQPPPAQVTNTPAPPAIQRFKVFGAYSYLNVDFNGLISRQSFNGWEASITVNANRWIAGEGDVSGYYKSNLVVNGVNAHDYGFMGGPRVNLRAAFVHALFGMDRLTLGASGLSGSQNGFAAAFGGGVEVKFSDHWAVRLSADYVLSRHNLFGGPRVNQNNFRASGGIVYAFGR